MPQEIDISTREGQIMHGNYIVDMEVAYDNCQNRLYEIRDVIQVQGGIVTDTLVEEKRKKLLGIF